MRRERELYGTRVLIYERAADQRGSFRAGGVSFTKKSIIFTPLKSKSTQVHHININNLKIIRLVGIQKSSQLKRLGFCVPGISIAMMIYTGNNAS